MKLAATFVRDGLNALRRRNQKRTEQRQPCAESSTPIDFSSKKTNPESSSSATGTDSEIASAPDANQVRVDDQIPSQPPISPNFSCADIEPNETGDIPSPEARCSIEELAQALRTLYPIPSRFKERRAILRQSNENHPNGFTNEIPPPDRRDSGTASTFPDKTSSSWMRSSILLSRFLIEYIDVKAFFQHRSLFEKCETVCSETVGYTIEVLHSVVDDDNDTENESADGGIRNKADKEEGLGTEEERRTVDLLRLLRIFSRMDAVSKTISQRSGITFLTKLIRQHPFTAAIQTECSAVLANLASHPENRTAILEQGCIGLLLKTMQRFKDSVSVQTEVCAALANLGCRGPIGKSILSQNGCTLITDAMRLHILSAEMQIHGFHALSSIVKSRWTKMNGGAGEVTLGIRKQVMLAMRKHQWNPDVMSAACSAIGCDTGLSSETDKIMEYILLGLSRFRLNAIYITAACLALAQFPFTKASETELLKKFNGIGYILDAMKAFPYHESLQTTALFALGSIVGSKDDIRTEMLEKGGVTAVLQSMGKNYDNAQDNPCDEYIAPAFSVSLISESNDNLPEASEPLQTFSKRLLLQMFGAIALLKLKENAKCKDEVLRLGGIHYIFNAAQMVHECLHLRHVIYHVFGQFAGPDTRSASIKSMDVPSLSELCRCSVMDQIAGEKKRLKNEMKGNWETEEEEEKEKEGANEDPCEVAFRNDVIDALPLPGRLKEQLKQGRECVECGKSCFESSVRQYDMRGRKVQALCSLECGKLDTCDVIAYRFPPE